MNEQLQRLARQAGFCGTGFHNTLPGTTHEDALKNFSQLIVRECANLPFKSTMEVTTIGEIAVSTMILKHFGVTE